MCIIVQKSKTDELVAKGAVWCDTPEIVAAESEVVFTMVGYPADVEEVLLWRKGNFSNRCRGKIFS